MSRLRITERGVQPRAVMRNSAPRRCSAERSGAQQGRGAERLNARHVRRDRFGRAERLIIELRATVLSLTRQLQWPCWKVCFIVYFSYHS